MAGKADHIIAGTKPSTQPDPVIGRNVYITTGSVSGTATSTCCPMNAVMSASVVAAHHPVVLSIRGPSDDENFELSVYSSGSTGLRDKWGPLVVNLVNDVSFSSQTRIYQGRNGDDVVLSGSTASGQLTYACVWYPEFDPSV